MTFVVQKYEIISSVGIAGGGGGGWTAGVRFLAGVKVSSLLHSVQTDSGVHRSSYTMGLSGWGGPESLGIFVSSL
jgi:hypothetical protein